MQNLETPHYFLSISENGDHEELLWSYEKY